MFAFDQVPDRRKSDSIKWQRYGNKDVVPMWIVSIAPRFDAPPSPRRLRQDDGEEGFGLAAPMPGFGT
jgi:cysteine-S-conjugate beta-lyase